MTTKYTTGQTVLVPATIRSAEERDGQIIYHVESDMYDGIPEDAILLNEDTQIADAMRIFRDKLFREERSLRY